MLMDTAASAGWLQGGGSAAGSPVRSNGMERRHVSSEQLPAVESTSDHHVVGAQQLPAEVSCPARGSLLDTGTATNSIAGCGSDPNI
mmetsp:Transcript_4190/g.8066  ORF Transcript_4190/g.8066 Transcript_4190/m.8066 type:complete len:87 (-) Transcript_4190:32-292(-)